MSTWVSRRRVLGPVLGLLLATPLAASTTDPLCRQTAPEEVRLALPWPEGDAALERQRTRIGELLGDYYRRHGRCAGERDLLLHVAFGSDYEILSWLGDGQVDAGYVSDVALHLLEVDGTAVLQMSGIGPLSGTPRVFQSHLTSVRPGENEPRAQSWTDLEHAFAWLRKLSAEMLACKREATRPLGAGECESRETPSYRLLFPSHLSTSGFAQPIGWLATRLRSSLAAVTEAEAAAELRDEFWEALFRHSRFSIGELPSGEGDRQVVELRFDAVPASDVAEEPAGRGPSWDSSRRFADTLVITQSAAIRLLSPSSVGALERPTPDLPKGFAALLEEGGPRAFASMARRDPTVGVRTFEFTIEESVGFLRPHGRLADASKLALVLPGGGVKAAYQSGLIDELYRGGVHLQNYLAAGDASLGSGGSALEVDYVIGTSGGALLGYFVALLTADGPWDLTTRLWNLGDRTLASTDIFGWADLLRFLSFVAIFLTLCLWLAALSLPANAPLAPKRPSEGLPRRLRLILALGPLLVVSPIVIRVVNGEGAMEHIPVIEGIFYTVYLWVAMFADHSLILRQDKRGGHSTSTGPALALIGFGALLVVAALTFQDQAWVHRPVAFWLAYAVLWPLAAIGGPIQALRKGGSSFSWVAVVELVSVSVPVYLLHSLVWAAGIVDWLPQFLVAIFLLGLIIAIHVFVKPRMTPGHARYLLWLFVTSFFVMLLCQPEEAGQASLLTSVSGLGLHAGAYLVCIGLLLLFIGAVCWTYCSNERYELSRSIDFLSGLLVAVVHIVLVYLILLGVVSFLPGLLSPLELTGTFWIGLLTISLVAGAVIVLVGVYLRAPGWLVGPLRSGLGYLCEHHPTTGLISRRFLRIAVLAVLALGWWNLLVAPALYGNGPARAYLERISREFDDALVEPGEHPATDVPELPDTLPELTTRLVVTANDLAAQRTLYFKFVPAGEPCSRVQPRAGSPWEWRTYSASVTPASIRSEAAGEAPCETLPVLEADGQSPVQGARSFLIDAVFASGSPFPIFPAARVSFSGSESKLLVDGGYSNNVPVDAALSLGATRVLIVRSENPRVTGEPPRPAAQGGWLTTLESPIGSLAGNLDRIPGYLFERSQQVDKLSQRELFVVSLSPSVSRDDWPALFDFRTTTVDWMREVADADAGRRIGMVESWGVPVRRLTLLLAANGSRSMPPGRPAPADAPTR